MIKRTQPGLTLAISRASEAMKGHSGHIALGFTATIAGARYPIKCRRSLRNSS